MLFRLLLLFTMVPIIELALLIWIGGYIGWLETIGLVLLTGFVGAALARSEGLRTLRQIQNEVAEGRMPAESMVQGAMILIAGALLVTPGVLTDAFGLCVLISPLRRGLARLVIRSLRGRIQITHIGPDGPRPRRHVDARVTRIEEEN